MNSGTVLQFMIAAALPLLAKTQAFCVAILSARVLGPESFGLVVAIQTTASLFSVIGSAWASNVATIAIGRRNRGDEAFERDFPALVVSVVGMMAVVCLVVSMPLIPNANELGFGSASRVGAAALYLFVQVVSIAVYSSVTSTNASMGYFRKGVILLVATIPVAWTLVVSCGVEGAIVAASVWHGGIGLLVIIRRIRDETRGGAWISSWRQNLLRTMKAPLRPRLLIAPVALVAVQLYATLLMARESSGLREIALFYAAFQWKTVVVFAPVAWGPLVLSRIMRASSSAEARSSKNVHREAYRSIAACVVSVLLGVLLVFPFRELLMSIYGSSFLDGVAILNVLLIAAVFSGMSIPLEKVFIAQGMEGVWGAVTVIGCGAYALTTSAMVSAGGISIAYGVIACLGIQVIGGVLLLGSVLKQET